MEIEIEKSLAVLKKGGVLLYPTDTIWGIGCDATNFDAVKKIYELKKRIQSKAFICLVSSAIMLKEYVKTPNHIARDIIHKSTKPTTIIYETPIHLASNLIAEDHTVAIRVVKEGFCNRLISAFKKPLVATSANRSGQKNPLQFSEISPEILKGVDYIVNLQREIMSQVASSIIKLGNDGLVTVIRE